MTSGKRLTNGALVDGAMEIEVINPATAVPFAVVARADAEQLEQAIAAAKAAAPGWAARGALLTRLAGAIEAEKDAFAKLLTTEQGKPLGVVAAITPWNFPFLMQTQKPGPALIAGKTAISKPAPTTPMCALKIGEIAAQDPACRCPQHYCR